MEITISVKNPTPTFQKRLLELLSEYRPHVELDATWTFERACRYYNNLPPRAGNILEEASKRGGYVPADALRGDETSSLRGWSGAFKRVLERGMRKGWWPEGMQLPIAPNGPGFGKVQGYEIPEELRPVFQSIFEATDE